jgi:hypothetical protein
MSNLRRKVFFIVSLLLLITHVASAQEQTSAEKEESIFDWIWNMIAGELANDEAANRDLTIADASIYKDLELSIPIAGDWRFIIGDSLQWKEKIYNDGSWDPINVPEDWELQGYHGYDGFAWYRYHFDGRGLSRSDINFVMLGFIDDVDETYLNGELIGKSGMLPPRFRTAYNAQRRYPIPNEFVDFEGDNVIAIRVYDDYKSGGICSGDIGFYAKINSNNLNLLQNLAGLWKFNDYDTKAFSDEKTDDSGWSTIMVPSYWDNHGYRTFDGVAWYRKHFKLNFEVNPNENYYLVVGKIDDFDVTFLNGQQIGQTNDGKQFGESDSYRNVRIYRIPDGLLKKTANNVIAIKVQDMGLEGGIYSGVLGIVEGSSITVIREAINR